MFACLYIVYKSKAFYFSKRKRCDKDQKNHVALICCMEDLVANAPRLIRRGFLPFFLFLFFSKTAQDMRHYPPPLSCLLQPLERPGRRSTLPPSHTETHTHTHTQVFVCVCVYFTWLPVSNSSCVLKSSCSLQFASSCTVCLFLCVRACVMTEGLCAPDLNWMFALHFTSYMEATVAVKGTWLDSLFVCLFLNLPAGFSGLHLHPVWNLLFIFFHFSTSFGFSNFQILAKRSCCCCCSWWWWSLHISTTYIMLSVELRN